MRMSRNEVAAAGSPFSVIVGAYETTSAAINVAGPLDRDLESTESRLSLQLA